MSEKDGTGLVQNLEIVYRSYGGHKALFSSGYFWMSAICAVLCWRASVDGTWVDYALPILPTLAGFSIAAYAVFFSVLSERERASLQRPSADLDGRAPLLVLASSVSHAVAVQVGGILLAIIFRSKPFPTPQLFSGLAHLVNITVSMVGIFVTIYGIVLVLASVLSIFRILFIKSGIS